MKQFEKLEQFKKQREETFARQGEWRAKQDEAARAVEESKREYAELVARSVREGINLDKQIDEADTKVSDAERAVRRIAAQAQALASTSLNTNNITPEDVVDAWNTDYAATYFEEVLNPAIDELGRAAAAYKQAYEKATEVAKEIENERLDMINTIDGGSNRSRFMYKTNRPDLNTVGGAFHKATLTEHDLYQLDNLRRAVG
ncbi:hypothetical protein [Paenibacillus sp. TC-CSREp1]|uniref:hypothetical protein n=1 Tax=Paenibacillus sp. TC-CSREp1 TaxID=3410089 RepID=UPI003CE823CA